MSVEQVNQVLGRALMDETFRAQLLNNPESALKSFDLSSQEIEAIKNVSADQFQALNETFQTQLGSAQGTMDQASNYLKFGDIPQEIINANPDAFIPGRLKWTKDGVKYTPDGKHFLEPKIMPGADKVVPNLVRKIPGRLKWIPGRLKWLPGGTATLVGVSLFAVLAVGVGVFAILAFVGANIFLNNQDSNNTAALQATPLASQVEVTEQGGVDSSQSSSIVIQVDTSPSDQPSDFAFSGVGYEDGITIPAGGNVVVEDLVPGSYTMTQADPAPEYELAAISCDDSASASPSTGSPSDRTAYIEIDPGETVTCTFVNTSAETNSLGGSSGSSENGKSGDSASTEGINPFTDPDTYLIDFPLPADIPPDAGTYLLPFEGVWSATNFSGTLTCESMTMSIPSSPPEQGTLTILDDGMSILGESFGEAGDVSLTMTMVPEINGRFVGSIDLIQEGVPITNDYFWQVVTRDYIIGYLIASFTSEGVTCSIYRSFELVFVE